MYLASVDDRMSLEFLEGTETICGGILGHYGTFAFQFPMYRIKLQSQT